MAIDAGASAVRETKDQTMTWVTLSAVAVAGGLLTLPAMAATHCSIGAIHGLLHGDGARVTMRVSDNDQACGAQLWVQKGVIPFTRLQQVKAPEHGDLTLDDPRRFSYRPEPGYRGPDSFDLIAFGNNRGGSEVTGRLHVTVSVSMRR
jgi:hypothetical protein